MAILFAGTSILDFPLDGNLTADVDPTVRAPYAKESVKVNIGGVVHLPCGSATDFWVTFYAYGSRVYSPVFDLMNGANPIAKFSVGQTEIWDGAAYQVFGGFTLNNGELARFDVHFKLDAAAGRVEGYKNGVSFVDFTGDTTGRGGVTGLDVFGFDLFSRNAFVSGCIVADTSTLNMVFTQQGLVAAGTYSQWAGTVADVDEAGINDLDFMTASNHAETSTFTKEALPAEFNANYAVESIVLAARVAITAPGDKALGFVRSGGVDAQVNAFGSGEIPLTNGAVLIRQNPVTGLDWTFGEADAAEVGIYFNAGDPDYESVALLLQFDGVGFTTDGSQYQHVMTTNAPTAQAVGEGKFADGFQGVAGSAGNMTTPWDAQLDFSVDIWTYEFQLKVTDAAAGGITHLMGEGTSTGSLSTINWQIYTSAATDLIANFLDSGGGAHNASFGAITKNVYHHICVQRYADGVMEFFVDGVLKDTYTIPALKASQFPYGVGSYASGASFKPGNYLDEVRLTKGKTRYPRGANFTPPTEKFFPF